MEHSRESLAIYQLLIKGDRWGLVFSLGFGAFNAFWRRLRGECEWITEQLNRQRGFGASEEFFLQPSATSEGAENDAGRAGGARKNVVINILRSSLILVKYQG